MSAVKVDLSELPVAIERFKRLLQSTGFTLQSNVTALDVLQLLVRKAFQSLV